MPEIIIPSQPKDDLAFYHPEIKQRFVAIQKSMTQLFKLARQNEKMLVELHDRLDRHIAQDNAKK